MCAAAVCLPQQFCSATAHLKLAEAFCKASLPSPKHRHPSVHFLFRVSAVPVGLPRPTWRPQLAGREGGRRGGWSHKMGKGRRSGRKKTFYEDLQEEEGEGLGSCMPTQTTWVKDQITRHPASVLGGWRGWGLRVGDLESQQHRPLQTSNTSFVT